MPNSHDMPTSSPVRPPGSPPANRIGRYRVERVLGVGGMGAVYLGHDDGLRRQVALKVMLPALANDPEAHQRFLREARAAASIKSDHVVTIYEVGENNGQPFIAMEYLHGQPLDALLRQNTPLTLEQILRIGAETAAGLAAAHALGLIHRDIKPANLWLESPTGRVKLLDFGLARGTEAGEALTVSGTVMGTPEFMSPEQARSERLDGRSDLFSLGGVLYRLLTGQNPFPGKTTMAVLTALAVDPLVPIRRINPTVPEPLAALVERLLAKDPDRRPPSALQIETALRGLLTGASQAIPTPPGPNEVFSDFDSRSGAVTQLRTLTQPPAPRPSRSLVRVGLPALAGIALLVSVAVFLGWPAKPAAIVTDDGPPVAASTRKEPTATKPEPVSLDVLTSPAFEWTDPEPLTAINSPVRDEDPTLTGDGLRLLFASNREGGFRLYEARRRTTQEPFGDVRRHDRLGDGSHWVGQPFLSRDGKTVWFSSERPGGYGNRDLWTASRADRDAAWGEVTNLGPSVNTPDSEMSPGVSPDGLTLSYAALIRGGNGDILQARRHTASEPWGQATALPDSINTTAQELLPRPLSDGKSLAFGRLFGHSIGYDWWLATPKEGGWEARSLLRKHGVVAVAFSDDPQSVVFSGMFGESKTADLWQMRRVPVSADQRLRVISALHQFCSLQLKVGDDPRVVWHEPQKPLPTKPFQLRGIRLFDQPPENARALILAAVRDTQELETLIDYGGRVTWTEAEFKQLLALPATRVTTSLILTGVELTPGTLGELKRCPKLVHLGFATTKADDEIFTRLVKEFASLNELHLSRLGDSAITHRGFASLADSSVGVLWLSGLGERIDAEMCQAVAANARLRRLQVSDARLDDEMLAELAKAAELSSLTLSGTTVTEAGVNRFRAALPRCSVQWNGVMKK